MNVSIPIVALKFQRKGKGKYIVPFFLKDDNETGRKLQKIIEYYKSMSGKKMVDFNDSIIIEIMGDMKVGRGIQSIMGHSYCFKSPDFKEIFSSGEQELLSKMNISSADTLRQALFEYVNKKYRGFAPDKKKAMQEFRNKLGLKTDIEPALWLDCDDEKLLKKIKDPKEVVVLYNQGVLATLFLNSENISITLPKLDGKILRKIYLLCKYNGVLCDISGEIENNKYALEISGPVELFGKPEKYGYNISTAALSIFRILSGKDYSFSSNVFIKNRKFVLFMSAEDIKNTGIVSERKEETGHEFDSAPEEKLYNFFSANKHSWKIEREPELIITKSFVYVPDFAYSRSKSWVYVEIMGYFTEHYQKKKIEKLKCVKKLNIPMIIIASSTYEDSIKKEIESIGYPLVYFKGKDIPYGPVLRVLEEKFSDFDERISEIECEKEKIASDMEKELETSGFISDALLKEKLRCFTDDEFEKCRDKILGMIKGTYIRGAGLFSLKKLDDLKSIIEKAHSEKRDREYLKKRFAEIGVDIVEPVLAHFGCAVKWKGLRKTEIIRRKN